MFVSLLLLSLSSESNILKPFSSSFSSSSVFAISCRFAEGEGALVAAGFRMANGEMAGAKKIVTKAAYA